jgi:hypothetical protein
MADVPVETRVSWDGDQVLVDVWLTNHTERVLKFTMFCQAARRGRAEGPLAAVGPGVTHNQRFRLMDAAGLAGTRVHLSIQEIRGSRALDLLIDVPPPDQVDLTGRSP